MKMIGLYKMPNGATGGMFVYGCCMHHAAAEWAKFMKQTYPEMNVMYVRPVRLHEHKLNLMELYTAHIDCVEGRKQ